MILLRAFATISELINYLFGTHLKLPIFSFGFFVAMAFLIAAYVLTRELQRKEKLGLLKPQKVKITVGEPPKTMDIAWNVILGFILGYKLGAVVLDYNSFVENPQAFMFSGSGNIIGGILGAGLLGYLKYYEQKKQQLPKPEQKIVDVYPHQRVGDITIIAAISGILGAKIFSNFEEPGGWKQFIEDPMGNFFSGLTIYGGLILGAASVIYYAVRKKINVLHLGDAIAPAIILAYGIGRIGCQTAGDGDWGIYNSAYISNPDGSIKVAAAGEFDSVLDSHKNYFLYAFENIGEVPSKSFKAPGFLPQWTVAQNYAHNVNEDGIPIQGCEGEWCAMLPIAVFPTPMYETIMAVAIFLLLMFLRKRWTTPGLILGFYIVMTGVERFFIEKIRVNNVMEFMGIRATQAEFISVAFILFGLVFMWLLYRRNKKATV